ncbi:MAG TPA: hypothetical protein DCS07_16800 [Bdellovibrionales bacterium]|nr:MAG: hypothetical protein A2Z97_06650 [Bdellovibrionales bacterium GWB1_52_6]OFZ05511.1 MAG: hypothetical protein A2X97_11595 [Bdellovibrionales bacterium GWA1_52_35]OFZ42187.1 MAG: hypothetical protein A2070_00565 [Bdellovibrionales bacterium GWC1_52_8]HAR44264.1 hypothetical protein [Bdellovibrionales bacterium]HCM39123.1 hypothetical protein [Bdellovibrionales bacterium]
MIVQELSFVVTRTRELTPTVFELVFEVASQSPLLGFKGGQFISIVIPAGSPFIEGASPGRNLRRAYSIASAPENRSIELCIKKVEQGPGSGYLASLKPGDRFQAFAPYGDFTYRADRERNACFIATGTGVAPIRAMILSKDYSRCPPKKALLVYGARSEEELLYGAEFDRVPELQFVAAFSQPQTQGTAFKGRVTDYLRQLAQLDWATTDFYLCGSGAMILEIKAFLKEKGVPKEAIHSEAYYR